MSFNHRKKEKIVFSVGIAMNEPDPDPAPLDRNLNISVFLIIPNAWIILS